MSHRAFSVLVSAAFACFAVSSPLLAQFGPPQPGFEPPERREATDEERQTLAAAVERLGKTANDVATGKAKVDAYLNLVWGGDGMFFREQRAWASELNKVRSIRYILSSKADVNIEGDNASGTIIVTVLVDNNETTLTMPAEFFRLSQGEGEQWLLAKEDFSLYSGSRTNVLIARGGRDRGWPIARAMDAVRRHVQRGLGHTVDRMVQVKVYETPYQAGFMVSPTIAAFDGYVTRHGESIRIDLSALPEDDAEMRAFLTRAFTTYTIHEISGGREVPAWVSEGIGALAAERWAENADRNNLAAKVWLDEGNAFSRLRTISEMSGLDAFERSQARVVGQSFIGYISDEAGRDARNEWFHAIAKGATPEEAAEASLGKPLPELWKGWTEYIASNGWEDPDAVTPSDDEG